jgi:hypothetical protein
MDVAELLARLHTAGWSLSVDGGALVLPDGLPARLETAATHWRNVLAPLLSFSVTELREGMTDDEREAYGERAAIIEHEGRLPRELAERCALWLVRTPPCERRAHGDHSTRRAA